MKVGKYLLGFLLVMAILIMFSKRGLVDNYSMSKRLAGIKTQNNEIMAENNELKKKIILLRSDLGYIESVARNELGMVKKGDLVYRWADSKE
jgi:cell division protein FtsB